MAPTDWKASSFVKLWPSFYGCIPYAYYLLRFQIRNVKLTLVCYSYILFHAEYTHVWDHKLTTKQYILLSVTQKSFIHSNSQNVILLPFYYATKCYKNVINIVLLRRGQPCMVVRLQMIDILGFVEWFNRLFYNVF